ncbi:MAG: SIS domain-containing protein [Anaerolineales bacterium]|nr:SIS domain-containing protein [Anaerolineales bacterium]
MNSVKEYIEAQMRLLSQLKTTPVDQVIARLERARVEGHRIFLFGNGGSAATASHFACDLGKGTIQPDRPRLQVMSLADNVVTLTAYANDHGFDTIFADQLITYARPGDIAIAFTASGNSPNVVRAVEMAEKQGLVTIAFTGFDGGKVKDRVELNVHVPVDSFPFAEDAHLILTHAICEMMKLPHEPH